MIRKLLIVAALLIGTLWIYLFNAPIIVNGVRCTPGYSEAIEDYRSKEAVFKDRVLDNIYVDYFFADPGSVGFIDELVSRITGRNIELPVDCRIDLDRLEAFIEKENASARKPVNAEIRLTGNGYELKPEIVGNVTDLDRLINDLESGRRSVILADYRVYPEVRTEDLRPVFDKLLAYVGWTAEYSNGVSISCSTPFVHLSRDNQIILDDSFIKMQIKKVASSYYNVGGPFDFQTTRYGKIRISGGTYGDEVDIPFETDYLSSCFRNLLSVKDREPLYANNRNEIGDTYVEVSIDDQHLWFYRDGEFQAESDVVTGKVAGRHDTPTGVYYILEMVPGKHLRGADYVSWVNRWMRVTWDGVGLHDATWRRSFGGQIYRNSGSHGCINLPKDFAYGLYKEVYLGMPVIIF